MRHYSRHLRDCFGCFPTGVTVATTVLADGSIVGVTVNSFSSVSLDPPLLLFSLGNTGSSIKAFSECRYFAVNILTENQVQLSRKFAAVQMHQGQEVQFRSGNKTGAPIIQGVLAYFECEKEAMYEGGDHYIFVGRVVECDKNSEENPLLYYKGTYRNLGATL